MIRNTILVLLTIIALVTGIVGISAGSGYTKFSYLWANYVDGEQKTSQSWHIWIGWWKSRKISIRHVQYLDKNAIPQTRQWTGPGWTYRVTIDQNEHTGLYFKAHTAAFFYYIPLIVSLLCSIYPTLVFYRGPLRRWRRRRKGLCLKCGYNLTGNTTGICSECGTEIIL